jgi:hypothetical protein
MDIPKLQPPSNTPQALVIGDIDHIVPSSAVAVLHYAYIRFQGKGRLIIEDGSDVTINADYIETVDGVAAVILGMGRSGDPGKQGSSCSSCGSNHQSSSSQEYDRWVQDCKNGTAIDGNYGGRGHKGENGRGARIKLNVREVRGTFACKLEPGTGGQGGPRGKGRHLCDQSCNGQYRYIHCAKQPDPEGRGDRGDDDKGECVINWVAP